MDGVNEVLSVVLIGAGATAVMDLWTAFLNRLGVATLNYALVGRWAGHLFRGTFAHASIGAASPVRHERALGWIIHYASGIAFAALLVIMQGTGWLLQPQWLPALAVGATTVAVPLLVMQPAMGAGIAASRTPAPLRNCMKSLAMHVVFGGGLYLAAALLANVRAYAAG